MDYSSNKLPLRLSGDPGHQTAQDAPRSQNISHDKSDMQHGHEDIEMTKDEINGCIAENADQARSSDTQK